MRQKNAKLSRKIGQKEFDKNARKAIMVYVDRLVAMPFPKRLAYAWRFVRGKNPHTNE
jgi:hypothetical protein